MILFPDNLLLDSGWPLQAVLLLVSFQTGNMYRTVNGDSCFCFYRKTVRIGNVDKIAPSRKRGENVRPVHKGDRSGRKGSSRFLALIPGSTVSIWCRDNIGKCFCRISVNKTGYPEQASGRLETGENNRFAGMEHNGETAYGTIILPGNNQCILAADLSVPCRPVQGSGWTQ